MNRLTPLEIQRAAFPRRVHGYDPDAVRELLTLLAQQVEEENRTRGELKAQLARLGKELEEYRERTDALSEALVAAQRAAEATVAQAEEKNIELVTTQLRERRRATRADLRRLAELLVGLARDDEASEERDAEPPSVTLLRPRRRESSR
jgi:DivIVA domain-containing protein